MFNDTMGMQSATSRLYRIKNMFTPANLKERETERKCFRAKET